MYVRTHILWLIYSTNELISLVSRSRFFSAKCQHIALMISVCRFLLLCNILGKGLKLFITFAISNVKINQASHVIRISRVLAFRRNRHGLLHDVCTADGLRAHNKNDEKKFVWKSNHERLTLAKAA